MKVQFDKNLRTDKNHHYITCGIFYCRVSAGFSVSTFNKLSINLTGQCSDIGNKITANRYKRGREWEAYGFNESVNKSVLATIALILLVEFIEVPLFHIIFTIFLNGLLCI